MQYQVYQTLQIPTVRQILSQEEQMLKRSIFAQNLQDFFTVTSLTKSTITNIWFASYNFSMEWLNKLKVSQ